MKKLVLLFAVAASCIAANASYLYWQVDANDFISSGQTGTANLYATLTSNGEGKYLLDSYTGTFGMPTVQVADLGSYTTGYSYFVELVNSSSQVVSTSVGDIANNTYSSLLGTSIGTDSSWVATVAKQQAWKGGTQAVPEPTSGLLTLIGMALLGLRRKRA